MPKCSMGLELFPHVWLKFVVNVGEYSIPGANGMMDSEILTS